MRVRYLLLAAGACCLFLAAGCRAEEAAAGSADLSGAPKVNPSVKPGVGTDAAAAAREAEAMSSPVFQRKIRENAEKHEFQAEVGRLMDIIVHSLYSNKDIFLRELISNASDALDKIRFLSLTDPSVLGEGDTAKLEVKIWVDKVNKVLYMRDRGIGMTHADLVNNLGTIAKSGTSAFLEQVQKSGDMNLIGQFGVGFYSVYLVSDYVEVVTKHNDDKQWIWSSDANGSFTISEDTGENEPLGRGTLLKIHLKEEAQEYLQDDKLKGLVAKYSEFISVPIYLLTEKEVEVPVEEEGEEEKKEEASKEEDKKEEEDDSKEDDSEGDDDEDDVVDDDEDKDKEDKPKEKKTRKDKRNEWELLNDVKAIWLRKAGDIQEEEYQAFYKAISKDYSDALGWVHFKAEGDVEFKSLLFVPKNAPYDFYDKYYEKKGGALKLYVRRVFISDDVTELLPKYLAFIKGVVDSDTLPLNVSREMLQAHSSLKTIRKKLVRKVLDYFKKMADDEAKCAETKEGDEGRPSTEACGRYATFWQQYGKAIKLGIMEDHNNKSRLAKLLRVHTSASPDKLISLDEYVGRMKKGQKNIYFIAGANKEEVAKSPFAERLVKKGYEVVYFTDALDEYLTQHLPSYEDHTFANIAKEDLQLAKEDQEAEAKALKEVKEEFKPLTKWWKELLGDKVTAVKVSSRLSTTPCVVVSSKYGHSANMERIMKAQALSNPMMAGMGKGQRSLEINPRHPLVAQLKAALAAAGGEGDKVAPAAKGAAHLLYETALLESGYAVDDVKAFSQSMYHLMAGQLGVKDLTTPEEPGTPAAGSSSSSKGGKKEEAEEEEEEDKDEL